MKGSIQFILASIIFSFISANTYAADISIESGSLRFGVCLALQRNSRLCDLPSAKFSPQALEKIESLYLSSLGNGGGRAQGIATIDELNKIGLKGLKSIELTGLRYDTIEHFLNSPMASQIRTLKIRSNVGHPGAQLVAEANSLSELTSLAFVDSNLDEASVFALARSKNLGNVTKLDLSGNDLGGLAIGHLLRDEGAFAKLEDLQFGQATIRGLSLVMHRDCDRPMKRLAIASLKGVNVKDINEFFSRMPACFDNLETLDLSGNNIIGDVFVRNGIAANKRLSQVKTLVLSFLEPQAASDFLAAVAGFKVYNSLASLKLISTKLTGSTSKILADPFFANVRELQISNSEIGYDVLRNLSDSPLLAKVEKLDLSFNHIDAEGLRLLVSAPDALSQIHELSLFDNPLGAKALPLLKQAASKMPRLRKLSLGADRLDDSTFEEFTQTNFTALTDLNLRLNAISKISPYVEKSPFLKRLKVLDLVSVIDDAAEREAIKKVLPDTAILFDVYQP